MPRRRKRILMFAGTIVVLPILFVILIPTLVSAGLGKGFVENAIASSVNGTAKIDDLDVGWFGSQAARGVVIADEAGREAANVNVMIHAGLLSLVFGSVDDLQIEVDGAVAGDLREDGTTSFADLFAADGKTPGGGGRNPNDPKDPKSAKPFSLAGVPRTSFAVNELRFTLDLRDAAGTETLTIPKLTGTMLYAPGGDTTIDFAGETQSGSRKGSVKIAVQGTKLFDAAGRLTPAGAGIEATVEASGLPMPFDERVEAIDRFELTARTTDLAQRLDVGVKLVAAQKDGATSGLDGALLVMAPFAADGTAQFALDRMQGDLSGSRVPTALLQPFLADTPILLSRDVGPSLEVSAHVSAGADRDVVLDLEGEHAKLGLEAKIGADGAIVGRRLHASARVVPVLVGDIIESAARVEMDATSFRVPAAGADGQRPLAGMAFDAVIRMKDTARVRLTAPDALAASTAGVAPNKAAGADDKTVLTVGDLLLTVRAQSLAAGVTLDGGVSVGSGRVKIVETLTNLFDAAGNLALADAIPVGSITATDLDGLTLTAFIPDAATADIAALLLDGPIGATFATTGTKNELRAALDVQGSSLRVGAKAARRADALAVEKAEVTIVASPALLAALQKDSENPLILMAPSTISMTLAPFRMMGASFGEYSMPTEAMSGTATLDDARVQHEALKEIVVLAGVTAAVTAQLGEAPSYAARGSAQLFRRAKGAPIGSMEFDLTAATSGESFVPAGTITMSKLVVGEVERVLGAEKDAVAGWLGESGSLAVKLGGSAAAQSASLRSDFPNLTGELRASLEDDAIVLASDGLDITLRRAKLEGLFNPEDADTDEPSGGSAAPAAAAAAKGAPPVVVAADMPMRIKLPNLRLPRTLLAGEPFAPSAVKGTATVTAGPLSLGNKGGVFSTVSGLTGAIECDDLAKGIHLTLSGQAAAPNVAKPGAISIDGRIVDLVSAPAKLDFTTARLNMEATVAHVPTVVADAILGLEGLLVAAAGNEMNATFSSRGFSQRSGQLDARIETDNGFITGRLRGRKAGLRTSTDDPLRGELNILRPLRERLLVKIHPLLADIRTTENPLRFNVTSNALIPLDGDLSRMRGDLEITIGKVEIDAGSTTLGFLGLFKSGGASRATYPGFIEPIVAKIRNGVVTYDRFVVKIDKYTMAYEGKIDLAKQRIDLRTELPLAALAQSVKELEGYADKIIVPIVTRGSFDKTKTEIDPEFDLAGAALQAGFTGGLNKALGDQGIRLGDVLDNLFKKKGDPDKP